MKRSEGLLGTLAVTGIVGLILVFCVGDRLPGLSKVGLGLALVGADLFVVLAMVSTVRPGLARLVGTPLLALSLFLVVVPLLGFLIRFEAPAAYAANVGDPVTVTVSQDCATIQKKYRGSGAVASVGYECRGSQWTVDGRARTGLAHLHYEQDPAKTPTVQGWAVGDDAYSTTFAGKADSAAWWGWWNWWAMLAGVLLLIVSVLVLSAAGLLAEPDAPGPTGEKLTGDQLTGERPDAGPAGS